MKDHDILGVETHDLTSGSVKLLMVGKDHPITQGSIRAYWKWSNDLRRHVDGAPEVLTNKSQNFWDLYCSDEADVAVVAVDDMQRPSELLGFLRLDYGGPLLVGECESRLCRTLICRGVWVLPSHRRFSIAGCMVSFAVTWHGARELVHSAFDFGVDLARSVAKRNPSLTVRYDAKV